MAENYLPARFPVADPAKVKPLALSLTDIDAELKILEKWYQEHTGDIKSSIIFK